MSETITRAGRKPWGEAVATFFTCLALGPPIGGIVFSFAAAFTTGLGSAGANGEMATIAERLMTALFVGLFSVPFAFLIGGLQAAATGLFFAVFGWLRGTPPLWFAGLTALAVFAGAYLQGIADNRDVFYIMLLVHAVPILLCWLIIRTYWRARVA